MPHTMKAVTLDRYGDPDVLTLAEIPRPAPGPREALLRVQAAALNPVDYKTRAGGSLASQYKNFPVVLGWDVAGVVEELGPGASGLAVGDPVYGMIRFPEEGRAYAEYATTPVDHVAAKPESLSPVEAAAVPLAALTAWQALFEGLDLQPGQTLLVHAAAGGVGHFAVQLAKWKGARVIGTASAGNADFVRGLGADEVIDYKATPFEKAVQGVDAVLDSLGRDVQERSYAVLRPGGRLITIVGALPVPQAAEERGITGRRIVVYPSALQLREIAGLFDAGKLRVEVSRTYSLSEAPAAHRQLESGHTRGKIVFDLGLEGRT